MMAPIMASRTRRSGTFDAMRSVLSSTDAFSTEWPSTNARSSDWATSERNSVSAAAEDRVWMAEVCAEGSAGDERERDGPEAEVAEEMRERECPEEKSDSVSVSEAEVVEPTSESSRSETLSPVYLTSVNVKQYMCALSTNLSS